MRNFMDDLRLQRAPEAAWRWSWSRPSAPRALDVRTRCPCSIPQRGWRQRSTSSCVQVRYRCVISAGDLQIAKKGPIDLVTKVDLEVERMCRGTIAKRFPSHSVLAEELDNETDRAGVRHRWVFDPVDGTVNYAHGLPIFCSCLALEGRWTTGGGRRVRPDPAGAVHGRSGCWRLAERCSAPRI